MWILKAAEVKLADEYTIKNEPVASIDLMERAAHAFTNRFQKCYPNTYNVIFYCGPGNNGGDGYAIARQLYNFNYKVKVVEVNHNKKLSIDCQINKTRLEGMSIAIKPFQENEIEFENNNNTVIIDSIFGSGLNKPIKGVFEQAIKKINNLKCAVVAVDVPSGLHQDLFLKGEKINATQTITFQFPKLSFFLPQNEKYVGKWYVEDIGLDISFLDEASIAFQTIEKKKVQSFLKERKKFSHKGTYGHALVVAGSFGKMGAALLATKAVLKAGAGLVTAHIPKCGLDIMQAAFWEAMVTPDVLDKIISETKPTQNYNALAIGPGLGQDEATTQALEGYLKQDMPTVIDADALNLIAKNPTLKKHLKGKILTPHPKEFERLFGVSKNNYHRIDLLRKASIELECTIILKDAHTCIATPNSNSLYFNCTGNNGMATAGSGDVLTGLLTGLLAQGYKAFEAAVLGVYLHGLSGDLYAQANDNHSLTASDLINYFDMAFKQLTKTQ